MPDQLGTRLKATQSQERTDQGAETRSHTRDLGMSKDLTDNFTFASATARITGGSNEFGVFAVGDPILVSLTNLNNGYFVILSIDGSGTFITVDPPPKDEGPINARIRTG